MLLPLSWLKEYLGTVPAPTALADVMLMHGLEVEEIIDRGKQFDRVVVGEIQAIRPHPNADKLRLADVVVQPGGPTQEIVCGAPNIAVGQKVPVALLGAKLPNGMEITPRAIRGVVSNGMICAEDELGLGKNHAGVMVLDPAAKVGQPFADAAGLNDVIFDVALPANRADLMGVRGLAWEIGAMLGKTAKFKERKLHEEKTTAASLIKIKVAEPKLCPVYSARVINGVTIQPSPAWLQQRLQAAGMRSINAVVDATNYIMLEYGQPLHAFDAAKVQGTIVVRSAKAGERLTTLDGQARTLDNAMLTIGDDTGAIALAGVMGGQGSEVTGATTDIILEAAIFDAVSIRRTSRRLGLVSEASKRFEKGLWPSLTEQASAAAAALIVELCGGTVAKGVVHTGATKEKSHVVKMNSDYITERLGMTVSAAAAKKALTHLGFKVTGTKQWSVTVPAWRLDVAIPEDIVDEIGKMVGYSSLPKDLPSGQVETTDMNTLVRFKEEVKNILADLSLTEIISHAFYGQAATTDLGKHITVANPLDSTQQYLRKSLLPQMKDVLKREADAGKDAAVFEIGRVFDPGRGSDVAEWQPWKLAIGFVQKPDSAQATIFTDTTQKLFEALKADFVLTDSADRDEIVRGRRFKYGELDIVELMKKSKVTFGDWDPARHINNNVQYREQSKFPSVTRDIAFWWTGTEANFGQIIKDHQTDIVHDWSVTDRFSKDGRTSFALTFVYQAPDRTLTKAEVDVVEQKIKAALVQAGATIR